VTAKHYAVSEQVERRFSTWQQSLVEQRRSNNPSLDLIAKQQEFVSASKSQDELASYLSDKLGVSSELMAEVPPLQRVTADELLNTPFEW